MSAADEAFELREVQEADTLVLAVRGDLDLAAAEQLTRRFDKLKQARVSVLLDLSEVAFMDSSGIACVAGAVRDAQQNGWDLVVGHQLQSQVQRLIELVDGKSLFWPRER